MHLDGRSSQSAYFFTKVHEIMRPPGVQAGKGKLTLSAKGTEPSPGRSKTVACAEIFNMLGERTVLQRCMDLRRTRTPLADSVTSFDHWVKKICLSFNPHMSISVRTKQQQLQRRCITSD